MSFFEFSHTRTYDSDLGWLIKEVTRIADQYDSFIEYMNTHKVEYQELKARVTALETEISTFEEQINQRFYTLDQELRTDIDNKIAQVVLQVNEKLQEVDIALRDLENKFNQFKTETRNIVIQYYNLGKAYTDFKIEELINSLPELTTVYVYNPIKGHVTTLQEAVNDLYDLGRPEALTAREYDDLELTAAEYDALEILAIDYDLYGRRIFEDLGLLKNKWHYMFSPFTGDYVTLQTVISELASLHTDGPLGAITASEYDALELTAEDYDDLLISAHDYDWLAKSIFV